jgi:hypothetical protein
VTIFTLHAMPEGATSPVRPIPHGFAWGAFLFGPFWLAARRLWVPAAVSLIWDAGLVAAGIVGLLDPGAVVIALLLGAALVGLEGGEWRRRDLARRGGDISGLTVAADEAEALFVAAAGWPSAPAEAKP